jgi:hypothetical protein
MNNKIQQLLINHLMQHGHIELLLPDGMILEIGTVQEDDFGDLVQQDNYSWIIATRDDNSSVAIDSYNMGLRFSDDKSKIIYEDKFVSQDGEAVQRLDVV